MHILRTLSHKLIRRLAPTQWRSPVIALHDHRALYYEVTKVACSSLTAVCVDLIGFELPEDAHKHLVFRSHKYDHLIDTARRDAAKITTTEAQLYRHYWSFAFVRNPFDRLVSCYADKILPTTDDGVAPWYLNGIHRQFARYGTFYAGMSFEAFVRAVADIPDEDADRHIRSQWTCLTNRRGRIIVDFIGRFERLSEDVQTVAERLGIEIQMSHLLKSKRRPYQDYYTPELERIVAERYARDFELFGYEPVVSKIELPPPEAVDSAQR